MKVEKKGRKKKRSIRDEKKLNVRLRHIYEHILLRSKNKSILKKHGPVGIGGTVPHNCFFSNSSKRIPKNGT